MNDFIHQTVVRGLSLKALHLISGLQTNLEDLLLGEVAGLRDLDFGTRFSCGFSFNEGVAIEPKFLAGTRDTNLHQSSKNGCVKNIQMMMMK